MEEILQSLLLDPNLMYLVLIVAAWVGVLAMFIPGTGIIELLAGIGLLVGLGGLAFSGASLAGLVLFAASFVLYALAILRHFAGNDKTRLAGNWQLSVWALMLAATAVQFLGGLVIAGNLPALSLWVVLALALGSVGIYRWMLMPTVTALRPPPQSGVESLIGETAEVRRAPASVGQPGTVYLNGELWQAVADVPLAEGDTVEVVARQRMRLHVRPVNGPES